MKFRYINYSPFLLCCLFISLGLFSSCRKFLESPLSNSKILAKTTFSDDGNAISAVRGIYQKMVKSSLAGGGAIGISCLTGMSADELHNVLQDLEFVPFEQNSILSSNAVTAKLWKDAYGLIYQANDILEELEKSEGVTSGVKNQLKSEVLFVRSFCYFYLINLFGDVPLVLTTNYTENQSKSRTSAATIYVQITNDLLTAQQTIQESYVEAERVRPNKATVTALLARVYVYMGEWEKAELQSTNVIDSEINYSLADLNETFLKASNETIWQLASEQDLNTIESQAFLLPMEINSGSQQLTTVILNSFEPNDLRKVSWVGTFNDATTPDILYYPNKYKSHYYDVPTQEYFVVFRLAEQYLIRAEAAAKLGNLEQAISDLDKVRERAGLYLISKVNPSISKQRLLDIIAHERRIEFFAEWGHRWFDLKRTDNAMAVLHTLKPDLSPTDLLYPIPQSEFLKNPNLGIQNSGY